MSKVKTIHLSQEHNEDKMKTNDNSKKDNLLSNKKGFSKSKANFQKIMKDIDPFIKKKQVIFHSTAGKWCDTSILNTKC